MAVPGELFQKAMKLIDNLQFEPSPAYAEGRITARKTGGKVCPEVGIEAGS